MITLAKGKRCTMSVPANYHCAVFCDFTFSVLRCIWGGGHDKMGGRGSYGSSPECMLGLAERNAAPHPSKPSTNQSQRVQQFMIKIIAIESSGAITPFQSGAKHICK